MRAEDKAVPTAPNHAKYHKLASTNHHAGTRCTGKAPSGDTLRRAPNIKLNPYGPRPLRPNTADAQHIPPPRVQRPLHHDHANRQSGP